MVSDGELEALVTGGSGSSGQVGQMARVQELWELLAQDLTYPGATKDAARALVYLLGGEEEAMKLLRGVRARI